MFHYNEAERGFGAGSMLLLTFENEELYDLEGTQEQMEPGAYSRK